MSTEEKTHNGEETGQGGCGCGPEMFREAARIMTECGTSQNGKSDCTTVMRDMPQDMSQAMRNACCGPETDAKETEGREKADQGGCGCGPDMFHKVADKMGRPATEQKAKAECESWLQRMRQACCCPKGKDA